MCGIVGVASARGVGDLSPLAEACARLSHRGPDDAGERVSADRRVALGFRRLSIIDLSAAGNQPMTNEDGSVWIVFNGEVYNFGELRRELEERGHSFSSRTDTETLVHLYEEEGPAFLDRLVGMFALAVWDERTSRLLLARDRLGIKPLYYHWTGRRLLFASELKALLAWPDVRREVDTEGLADYLAYGYVPFDRSIVAGVRKLPPGHRLILDVRRGTAPQVERYWDVEYTGEITDEEEAAERLRELLDDAVRLHLVADVPLGLFLSGGLDSSSVLASMARFADGPVRSYAIASDIETQSELPHAALAARAFGCEHHERIVGMKQARILLPRLAEVYDEPLVDYSTIPTWHVSRFAREDVTVALSGDGGDELFGGYHWHARQLAAEGRRRAIASVAPFAPRLLAATLPAVRRLPYAARAAALERVLFRSRAEGYFRQIGYFDGWEQRRLLGPAFAQATRGRDHLWLFRRFLRPDLPPLAALRYLDLKTYLPDDILVKVDRASMAASLEVRVPLLDHRLVEYVFSIDDRLMLQDGRGKHVLRAAMRGILPEPILERGKRGFSSPVRFWLRSGLARELIAELDRWTIVEAGLIQPDFVRSFMRNLSHNRWAKLWCLVVLEQWHRRWICEQPARAPNK